MYLLKERLLEIGGRFEEQIAEDRYEGGDVSVNGTARFLFFCDPLSVCSRHGDHGKEPRACSALSSARLFLERRDLAIARSRIPGNCLGVGICRCGHGVVFVCRHDARCKPGGAESGFHQISTGGRACGLAYDGGDELGGGITLFQSRSQSPSCRLQQYPGARESALYRLHLSLRDCSDHPAGEDGGREKTMTGARSDACLI